MSLLMITASMFVFWAGGLSVQINLLSLSLLQLLGRREAIVCSGCMLLDIRPLKLESIKKGL